MPHASGRNGQQGQSIVELALLLPILVLLFIGMVEVVFISRSYLALLESSTQGAHLGSQGLALYNNSEIYTLITQNLLREGYDTSSLIDVIITRADLVGGNVILKLSGNEYERQWPGYDSYTDGSYQPFEGGRPGWSINSRRGGL